MPEAVIKPPSLSLGYPLDEFYAQNKLRLPPLQAVEPMELPEPYRTLLVHESDMTSTLENFYGERVHLKPHTRELRNGAYFRAVVLELDDSLRPAEFGCINIFLEPFPTKAREEILKAYRPLGRILKDFEIEYVSRPKAFLRIASDTLINRMLQLTGAHVLYGRRNTLSDARGNTLAEIIEILPPTAEPRRERNHG